MAVLHNNANSRVCKTGFYLFICEFPVWYLVIQHRTFSRQRLKTWSLVALDRGSLYRGQMNGKTQGRNKLGRITQEVVIWRGSLRQVWLYVKWKCKNGLILFIFIQNLPKSCASSQLTSLLKIYPNLVWVRSQLFLVFFQSLFVYQP